MNYKTVIVNQPHWIEMGMIFAAGYCVGRYMRCEVPTVAERTQGAVATVDENGTPVVNATITSEVLPVRRKPLIQYDPVDGTISFNLRRR